MRRLRILTWHVHGSYLTYLASVRHDFYLPVKRGRPEGYGGRAGRTDWPSNLIEVPSDAVAGLTFDCILFQSRRNFGQDQFDILSEAQRQLPRVYLEHDPPQEHPTNTRHPVDDPNVLLVHVTHFNRLMWDSGRTPAIVIEHGVTVPEGLRYRGELPRGIAVVNGLATRGRRLGCDVFEDLRHEIPLDLAGMESRPLGGLGELPPAELARLEVDYRFFFNPIRYTSLGLAVCEAMMLGLPIVGLATTEMVTVIEQGRAGFLHTDRLLLIDAMRCLLADPAEARRLGEGARRIARERFDISRFAHDWEDAFAQVTSARSAPVAVPAGVPQ